MSNKGKRIAAMAGQFHGGKLDPHYTGYFVLFNQQKYFEAHEVLEHIWLKDRHGPDGAFHKGLIQLAGAFVHLQKNRPQPASSLFRLALANLEKYPAMHEHLNLNRLCGQIKHRLGELERVQPNIDPPVAVNPLKLELERTAHE